jgi:hypothetical protein
MAFSRENDRLDRFGRFDQKAWWDIAMHTGDSDVKISNHFRSPYVRLMILENPELDGVFEMLPRRRRPDAGQS